MTPEPDLDAGEVNTTDADGRITRFRLRLGTAMIAVLVLGVAVGLAARWYRQRMEQEASMAEMRLQNSLTETELAQARAALVLPQGNMMSNVRGGGRSQSVWGSNGMSRDTWTTSLGISYQMPGSGLVELRFEVSGGLRGTTLEPISIETSGPASLVTPMLDRLTKAYDAKGWRYRVIRTNGGSPSGR